jgi:hypothetical protein
MASIAVITHSATRSECWRADPVDTLFALVAVLMLSANALSTGTENARVFLRAIVVDGAFGKKLYTSTHGPVTDIRP